MSGGEPETPRPGQSGWSILPWHVYQGRGQLRHQVPFGPVLMAPSCLWWCLPASGSQLWDPWGRPAFHLPPVCLSVCLCAPAHLGASGSREGVHPVAAVP